MSLEATLARTNELLEALLTRLATTPVTNTVAEATRYFVIEKHNTVYEQKPDMPGCSIDGAVEVDDATYEAKKAEFAAKVQAAIAANSAPQKDARDGLTATQAVEVLHGHVNKTAEAPAPAADVPFEQVVAKMVALNKSDKPGHGPAAVRAILVKYMPNEEKPTVPKLNGLGKNSEILAEVEALLNPATDEVDLFA